MAYAARRTEPRNALIAFAAAVIAGIGVAIRPTLVVLAIGTAIIAVLSLITTESFVFFALLARNISSGQSQSALVAGLNSGAIVGLVVLIVCALRIVHIPQVRGIVPALLLGFALVVWFVVAVQQFSFDPSLTREIVRSLSIVALAVVAANVRSNDTRRRVLTAVLIAAVIPGVVAVVHLSLHGTSDRVASTFAHPNEAAAMFSVALTIAVWRWLDTRRTAVYAPLVALFGLGLVGTQSLGGTAQMIVTLLAYAVLTTRFGPRALVVIGVTVALIVTFLLSPVGSKRLHELDTTTSFATASQGSSYTTNSLDWRFYNWARELETWRHRPYLGYGLGSTATIIAPAGNIPHSDPIRLLVETGVIGFALFGAAFLGLCRTLYRRTKVIGADAGYAALALATTVGLFVHGLVNNVSMQTATMYSAAVVVGCALARPHHASD